MEHKIHKLCSNYSNVPVLLWLKLVRINPFPLVIYRVIVPIKQCMPINRMSVKRTRMYAWMRFRNYCFWMIVIVSSIIRIHKPKPSFVLQTDTEMVGESQVTKERAATLAAPSWINRRATSWIDVKDQWMERESYCESNSFSKLEMLSDWEQTARFQQFSVQKISVL